MDTSSKSEYPYLNRIASPEDVKAMTYQELLGLTQDVRNRITSVIKKDI